jgi:hypothetical protein
MMRRLAATVAVVAALGASARATVTVPLDFRQVVSEASLIVQAHVTDLRAVSTARGVETVATLGVDATLKGTADTFVSVRVPGGELGNVKVVAIGAPKISLGEVAIFFLKQGADGVLRPVGLAQGVYPVAQDPQTRQTAVNPPLAVGLTTGVGPVVHGDPARQLMTVSEFSSLVHLVIASQARVSPRGGGR